MIGGRKLAAGGGVDFKVEHRHRGMKLGIAPHSPDDWGRQLAAGGDEENQNSSVRFYTCVLFRLEIAHAIAPFQSKL